ncbi:MAG TPA: 6-carboxytetrahydropterin synthase QueD [Thermoleophilia bacterium]|nr:6-carboxytetrahydropterin synthase QueD [Thermoleophilia bacterium]
MRTTITKIFTFDSAHSLPEHLGKCRNVHGHTYTMEVAVEGPVDHGGPTDGMVMDFADLRARVAELVVGPLDHRYLNDLFDFAPTAEALASWAMLTLREAGLAVVRVRLWETPTSYAEVSI